MFVIQNIVSDAWEYLRRVIFYNCMHYVLRWNIKYYILSAWETFYRSTLYKRQMDKIRYSYILSIYLSVMSNRCFQDHRNVPKGPMLCEGLRLINNSVNVYYYYSHFRSLFKYRGIITVTIMGGGDIGS